MIKIEKTKGPSSEGIGVLGLLGVVFTTLKLTGHIVWSWWWVTAPFWGLPALLVIGAGVLYLIAATLDWIGARRRRLRRKSVSSKSTLSKSA